MRLRSSCIGTAVPARWRPRCWSRPSVSASIGALARARSSRRISAPEEGPPAKGPVQPLRKGADRRAAPVPEPRAAFRADRRSAPSALPQNARTAPSTAQSQRQGPREPRQRAPRASALGALGKAAGPGERPATRPSRRTRRLRQHQPAQSRRSATSRAIARFGNIGPAASQLGNRSSAARLHQSRPAHARRERRDAAAAAGAALQPSQRDVRDPRPHAALSPARRAQLHRRAAGQRDALRRRPKWSASGDPTSRRSAIEEIARQHNLTIVATQRSALTGGTLVHFRIGGNRAARDVVRAMEAERIVSQPNYVYCSARRAAAETAAAQSGAGDDDQQYVANKLRLAEVHKIATGKDVMVAVIDSEIDDAHPELAKGIAEQFDAVGKPDKPHTARHRHGRRDRLAGPPDGRRARRARARRPCLQRPARSNRRRRRRRASSPGSNGR